MTNLELVLNMLAEVSTKDISKAINPKNFAESKKIAKQGGTIAGNARKELEAKTGKKVVVGINAQKFLKDINKDLQQTQNSPFVGTNAKGRVIKTIVGGFGLWDLVKENK